MSTKYIIGIDQSTQGTKALLFDNKGKMVEREDLPHEQIIDEQGWISHNPIEIYENVILVVKNIIEKTGICKSDIVGVGISNQRETSVVWERETGMPIAPAIVWQCSRAKTICEKIAESGQDEMIRQHTGMNLSPYFPAAKLAWILEHVEGAKERAIKGELCFGTMDSWLIFKLTKGKSYKTDYSNASRTQLFNIKELEWDKKICEIFGIDDTKLAQVCDSNADFGRTDFEGVLESTIPIHGVLGDSHGALYGQGCLERGMIKTTYGTGSSIMMNIGSQPVISSHGVVTSLAWRMNGQVNYVLEGNVNYTGAVITWLKEDMNLINTPKETQELAQVAIKDDDLYLVPAFTGLGAPYWDSEASAAITGITRTTKKAEIVRAGLECIAYQIVDVIEAMGKDADIIIKNLRVDGGPTKNQYLMQFQSDILGSTVQIPDAEELSGIGVAYVVGLSLGIYDKSIFEKIKRTTFNACMSVEKREQKRSGWKKAVQRVLTK